MPTAPGCDAIQVNGILLSTAPASVFGKELLPMMSVKVATIDCEVPPLAAIRFVCPEPAVPISREMFWMAQVAKKSRIGEVAPEALVSVGCWNEVLVAPPAEA